MRTPLEWEDLYLRAFLETDPLNLPGRIADAEKAIRSRAKELRTKADGKLELESVEDALKGLAILKRELRADKNLSSTSTEQFVRQ